MWIRYYLGYGNLVVALGGILVGFLVISKDWRNRTKQAFFFLNMSVVFYALFYFFMMFSRSSESWYLWFHLMCIPVSFIAVCSTNFTWEWLNIAKKYRFFVTSLYISTFLVILFQFHPLFGKEIVEENWGYHLVGGPLFYVWALYYILLFNLCLIPIIMAFPRLSSVQKKQAIFIFLAGIVGVIGGLPNFLSLGGITPHLAPFTSPLLLFYVIFFAYAIIRYRAMEIDTVIHKTALWLLTLLLVILPIASAVTLSLDWIASFSRIAKLALTSIVLIFFVWYYSKLRPSVDHLFRRRKYDYYRVLGEIGQKIGSELDINNVVNRLFKELKDVIYIRNGLVLVQQPGQVNYTEAGLTGYEQLPGQVKPDRVILKHDSSLSQWLQEHQKALGREQVEIDPQYEPIKQEASSFINQNSIEFLIPVIMEDKVNALLGIGKKENLQNYTSKDIELLENMGRQIGITIDNAMHHEDIVEKERLAEEMKLGREIQMNLLPRKVPNISGLAVQGIMLPAKEIGGDYYDFITLPHKDHLAVVIGDVSGKGVAAGLLMAMAKTAIHTLSQDEASPKQILVRTNAILNQHIGGQKFMTMLYFRWDAKTRTLDYSSAGHEHILIYRADHVPAASGGDTAHGQVEAIVSGGFMLGMMPDIAHFLEDRTITLNPGDKVVLYTDGVTEARNPSEDLFGLPNLIDLVSKHGAEPATELLNSIKNEVYSYIGTREQFDDITLVVLEAV